jgi:hypothetical protein
MAAAPGDLQSIGAGSHAVVLLLRRTSAVKDSGVEVPVE